eukprot:6456989-Amphidinium_carterae.1
MARDVHRGRAQFAPTRHNSVFQNYAARCREERRLIQSQPAPVGQDFFQNVVRASIHAERARSTSALP